MLEVLDITILIIEKKSGISVEVDVSDEVVGIFSLIKQI